MFSDQELVKMTLKGNKNSFDEIVLRYSTKVYSLILRMLRDPTLAEDLTQDTFLRAYRSLDKYNPVYPFNNWILKIASNLCIDNIRKSKNVAFSDSDTELSLVQQNVFVDPQEAILDKEASQELARALTILPAKYRLVILLRYLEGLKYEEIATVLEEPLGTIKTKLYRARGLLKDYLFNKKEGEFGE